jgi:fibulin 1/2
MGIFLFSSDIDECVIGTHNCDKTNGGCLNNAGSYKCNCKSGFKLEADGKTCKGKALLKILL